MSTDEQVRELPIALPGTSTRRADGRCVVVSDGRPESEWPVYGSGGVVLRHHCGRLQVLVVVENKTNKQYGKKAGMLSIPMGSIESPPETPEGAVVRETLEETGHLICETVYLTTLNIVGAIVEIFFSVSFDRRDRGALKNNWINVDTLLALPDAHVRKPTKKAIMLALQHLQRSADS